MPHDSKNCPTCRGEHTNSMSDEEFAHFLYICRAERDAKQARMAEHLARRPYFYDIDQEILTVGGASHRIIVIGTFCLSRGTWLWGWANDSYSEAARQRSAALKGLRGVTGFQAFADVGTWATSGDASDLAATAIHYLNAQACWCEDLGDVLVFLALDSQPPDPAAVVRYPSRS